MSFVVNFMGLSGIADIALQVLPAHLVYCLHWLSLFYIGYSKGLLCSVTCREDGMHLHLGCIVGAQSCSCQATVASACRGN